MTDEEFDAKVIFNKENNGKTGTLEIMLKPPLNRGPIKSIAYDIKFVNSFFEARPHGECDASCENCAHAFRRSDPLLLKIIQDPQYLFYCAAGHAYGGSETVCSEWKRKEGEC